MATGKDPILAMLEPVSRQMMQIEAEAKVGARKGKHSKERRTYFSGTRVRRMDTRLGTIYLFIPKLRKGGYVPFFITQRRRSEAALIALIQEAFINGVSTRKILPPRFLRLIKGFPSKLIPFATGLWNQSILFSGQMLSMRKSETMAGSFP